MGRHVPHEHLVAGLASALRAGALTADAVALEARKAAEADEVAAPVVPAGPERRNVTSLTERRIKAAQFPQEKSLRAFGFEANGNVDAAVIHTLATCEWGKKGLPLCLIGDSGTGKSHLLIALGTEGAMAGFRVRYTLATKLVNELVEAADEKILTKTIARYGRVDLLCIDELGYMELDRRGAELLFQVLTEREEKSSVAIASNESFGGWTRTFTDPRLWAAIVDRLTFGGNIIETGTDSYRLAQTRARAEQVQAH